MTSFMQKKLLKIDSSVYPPSVIHECISLFEWYDITYSEKTQTLTFEDIDELIWEFFNCALSLTLEK